MKGYKKRIMNTLMNSVQLIGNVGQEPEFKSLDSGQKLVKFSLATNDYYKDKNGEKVKKTEWHNVVAWGNLAENMDKFLSKGNQVAVKGKLTSRSYDDKEGNKRYLTEVVVNEFMKLTKKEDLPF